MRLGTWPTPLEPAPRLAARLGLRPDELLVKRDDLVGLAAGGNKVRKLEFTCAAALADGATTLVTTGAAQSNHAALTAAAAHRLGLEAVLVLGGGRPAAATGNLVLSGLFGARVVWAGATSDDELAASAAAVAEGLRAAGRRPAVIPFGGSSALGARGYVECGRELLAAVPDLATVVVAVGSGGTMAGLVAALGVDRVLGVDSGAVPDPAARVAGFAAELGVPAADLARLRLRRDQVGPGYGSLTPAAASALRAAGECEGIVLDPVYTAKALAGLAAAVADGSLDRGGPTVFLHSGGLAGLFGHPSAATLSPREAPLPPE